MNELKSNFDGFTFELMGAVREYESAVFGTDEMWRWGWKHYRLDIPGLRYAVGRDGLNWLLIETRSISYDRDELRLVVEGAEVSPAKKYELFFVAGGSNASEEANEAVRRWNELVRVKREEKTK